VQIANTHGLKHFLFVLIREIREQKKL